MGNGVSKPQTVASASEDAHPNSTAMQWSDEDFDIVCVPCHRLDGTRLQALGYCCQCKEHLCGQCCQTHQKATPSRHHNILDKDLMPTTQLVDDYTQYSHTDTITKPCPYHKNEMLKLYCETHSLLLCMKCVALSHTKSCKVAYIPDISERMIDGEEYEETFRRIETLLTKSIRIKETTDADTNASNKSLDKVLKDLKQYRREIIENFDRMEKHTENEIRTLKQQNTDMKNDVDAKCDDAMKTVESAANTLNELNISKQADMLFVELKQTQDQLKDYEKTIDFYTTNNYMCIDEYAFVRSASLDDALQHNKMGYVSTTNPHLQDQVKPQTLQTKQQAKGEASIQRGHISANLQESNNQAEIRITSATKHHQNKTETAQHDKAKTTDTSGNTSTNKHHQNTETAQHAKANTTGLSGITSSTEQHQTKAETAQHTKAKTTVTSGITSSSKQHQNKMETAQHAKAKTTYISSKHNPVPASAYENIKPKYQGELINVKTLEDNYTCCTTGLTMISPNKLALVDVTNKSIKLVNTNNAEITSGVSLTGEPWDITSTSSTQIAVTLPHEQKIQFINVTDKLTLSHTKQIDGKCYGICCYNNKLVVTYIDPGKVKIMNINGSIIKCVEKGSTGVDAFVKPYYVQANSSYIYVSDREKQQVIMLNWHGQVTGRVDRLRLPKGLALLHDGSLLVCGYLGTVHHVSGDCTNKNVVLQGVRYPQVICVDDGGHKLFISSWSDNDADIDNNVAVYNI